MPVAQAETRLLRAIMLALSKTGARVFRNNCGVARYPDGSRVRYGLCPGSADLVGWRTITITPEHVGQRLAVFIAVEAKAKHGRVTQAQRRFLEAVQAGGGIAVVARSVEAAVEAAGGEAAQ